MRTLLALLLTAVLAAVGRLQEQPLAVGKPAPAFALHDWLDGKPPVVLGQGRACVLVFWATWCGSCLSEFPRLNELVHELENEPIDFVSVADETREKVAALLAMRPLKTRVALDDDGKTFAAFDVHVLPRLVLVDPQGKVAALPSLDDVSADVLGALASGEPISLPEQRRIPCDLEWDEAKGPLDAGVSLAHAWIERSQAASGGVRFPPDHGRISADGVGFANLVHVAYGVEAHEVESTHPEYAKFEQRYRFSIKAADDKPETARAMLREQLQRLFAFHAEWLEKEESLPVLRCVPGRPLAHLVPSTAAKSDGMARHGSIHYVKVPIGQIVASLGSFGFEGALLDETGLTGEYDLDLEWTPGSTQSFQDALASCGLTSAREPRKVKKLKLTR